jgi:hypothetical protein
MPNLSEMGVSSPKTAVVLGIVVCVLVLMLLGVLQNPLATKSTLVVTKTGELMPSLTTGLVSSGATLRHFGGRSDGYGGDAVKEGFLNVGVNEAPEFWNLGSVDETVASRREGLSTTARVNTHVNDAVLKNALSGK